MCLAAYRNSMHRAYPALRVSACSAPFPGHYHRVNTPVDTQNWRKEIDIVIVIVAHFVIHSSKSVIYLQHNTVLCSIPVFLTKPCQKDNHYAVFRRPVRVGYNVNEMTGGVNCPFGAAGVRKIPLYLKR